MLGEATTTCTVIDASTTQCLTDSPVVVRDSGDVIFMLAVLVFFAALQALGLLFGTLINPKRK